MAAILSLHTGLSLSEHEGQKPQPHTDVWVALPSNSEAVAGTDSIGALAKSMSFPPTLRGELNTQRGACAHTAFTEHLSKSEVNRAAQNHNQRRGQRAGSLSTSSPVIQERKAFIDSSADES